MSSSKTRSPNAALFIGCTFIVLLTAAQLSPFVAPIKPEPVRASESIDPWPCDSEHTLFGPPSLEDARCNIQFGFGYDADNRLPAWVAWSVDPPRLFPMARINPVRSFLSDPTVSPRRASSSYTGLLADPLQGYARGHVMPFWAAAQDSGTRGQLPFVDRNLDGGITEDDRDAFGALAILDRFDYEQLRAANRMTNVLPMHQFGFNNLPAAWARIEQWEREELAPSRTSPFFVVAGPVWGPKPVHLTDSPDPLPVPHAFFRLTSIPSDLPDAPPPTLAFLIPHTRTPRPDPSAYLVSVETVEAATGLHFFPHFASVSDPHWKRRDTALNLSLFPEL